MKKAALILTGMLFSSFISGTATAAESYLISGKVIQVGTQPQAMIGSRYESRMTFGVNANYCGGTPGSYTFYISLRSGTTAAQLANYRNIYESLLLALKDNATASISFEGGIADCSQVYVFNYPAQKATLNIYYSSVSK